MYHVRSGFVLWNADGARSEDESDEFIPFVRAAYSNTQVLMT